MAYPDRPGFASGSDTSEHAAASVAATAASQRLRVLHFLRTHGPATDQEIIVALGLRDQTGCPRRTELKLQGLVFDTGRRAPNRSGRAAVVWEALAEQPT